MRYKPSKQCYLIKYNLISRTLFDQELYSFIDVAKTTCLL